MYLGKDIGMNSPWFVRYTEIQTQGKALGQWRKRWRDCTAGPGTPEHHELGSQKGRPPENHWGLSPEITWLQNERAHNSVVLSHSDLPCSLRTLLCLGFENSN